MSKPPGKCAYCGRVGDLTKQHIIPDRVKHLVPRTETTYTQRRLRTHDYGSMVVLRPLIDVRNGAVTTRKVRRVCGPCNRGWMKDGETAGFTVAEKLIVGKSAVLSPDDQLKLALLAAIMISAADLDDPETSGILPTERTHLRENLEPPAHWFLYAGRTNSDAWEQRIHHHGLRFGLPGLISTAKQGNGQITTLGVGKLLLHGLSAPMGVFALNEDYLRLHGIMRLWPAMGHPVNWADLPVLDTPHADRLANELHNAMGTPAAGFVTRDQLIRQRKSWRQ